MGQKVVIIIANELDNQIPLFVFPCDQEHKDGIRNFIYENGLSIPLDLSAHEASFALTEIGFCVMLYDKLTTSNQKIENLIAYIPKNISPKQYAWFEKRKTGLTNYELAFYDYTNESTWNAIDKFTTDKPIVLALMETLNKKQISQLTNEKSKRK